MNISFFQQIAENTNESIIVKDLTGKILFWNKASENLFGFKSFEVNGKEELPPLPDPVKDEEKIFLKRILRGEKIENFYSHRLTRNNKLIPISVNASPLVDPVGNITAIFYSLRKIVDNKQAFIKFQSLLNSAPDAIVIINEAGRIQLVNNQTEKLFEYNRNELIGKKVELLIPDRYKHHHPQHRKKYFGDPKVRGMGAGLELFAVKKSGEEFPVDISLSPVDTEEGKWVSAAIRDITDLKLHLTQREQMKNKDMFLGIASHELKTPLTSIRAYMSLIEDRINEIPDETLKMYTSRLNKSIGNIEGLINDLLDVSRIQNEKLQFRMEKNWFNEVIQAAVESTQFETSKHNLIIEENEKINCIFDFQRIEQVLTNLLSNAIKYSPEGGEILIRSRTVNGEIQVSVKDFGIGIPPENKEMIFERFFRVNEKSFKYKGLGIGLFISKEIIQRHDGRIWVESSGIDGEGATFTFILPIR